MAVSHSTTYIARYWPHLHASAACRPVPASVAECDAAVLLPTVCQRCAGGTNLMMCYKLDRRLSVEVAPNCSTTCALSLHKLTPLLPTSLTHVEDGEAR